MTCKSLMTLKRRNYIRCIIIATFKEYQIRKQAKIDSFFKEVEYGPDVIKGMRVIKMLLTNFPAATTLRLPNAYYTYDLFLSLSLVTARSHLASQGYFQQLFQPTTNI